MLLFFSHVLWSAITVTSLTVTDEWQPPWRQIHMHDLHDETLHWVFIVWYREDSCVTRTINPLLRLFINDGRRIGEGLPTLDWRWLSEGLLTECKSSMKRFVAMLFKSARLNASCMIISNMNASDIDVLVMYLYISSLFKVVFSEEIARLEFSTPSKKFMNRLLLRHCTKRRI